jgi:hypothetical protein
VILNFVYIFLLCLDSAVCKATRYRLDSQGIETHWETKFSAPVQTGPQDYAASCIMGTSVFPCDKVAEAWPEPATPSSVKVK